MPLKNYGILKGNVIDFQLAKANSPHYQILVVDNTTEYRIAVNVRSSVNPPDLHYLIVPDFHHPITARLADLALGHFPLGRTSQERKDSGLALDFIRGNLFDRNQMRKLPGFAPGPDNDLNEKIGAYVEYAMGDESNLVYAFGERWGPEANRRDRYFGFLPGNGIHDIHMNQGSSGRFRDDNGVYQDGGLMFYFAAEDQWVAYFTRFQSQTWHTDDEHGHPINGEGQPIADPPPPDGGPAEPDHKVRIVAAMVNPVGPAPEQETVTLLNTTAQPINLQGWKLADKAKNKMPLSGVLPAGGTLTVQVRAPVQLSNQGGIITVLNANGLKIHGVAYIQAQARQEGETIVF